MKKFPLSFQYVSINSRQRLNFAHAKQIFSSLNDSKFPETLKELLRMT